MIFYFLRVEDDQEVQKNALLVIQAVSVSKVFFFFFFFFPPKFHKILIFFFSSKDCVSNISESQVMGNLLMLCHSLPLHHEHIVNTLLALTSNQKIVAECILKGGVIYILDLFCNSTNPTVRLGAASIFAKMCADKVHFFFFFFFFFFFSL